MSHGPLWAALVFFPSLVFGFFKDRTKHLVAPVILHVFYNAGYFWLFVRYDLPVINPFKITLQARRPRRNSGYGIKQSRRGSSASCSRPSPTSL